MQGGHLVEITTNEESELIYNNNKILGIASWYWLGLTKTGSSWSWEIEGGADFRNWASSEPNDSCYAGPNCNCAAIVHSSMNWRGECCTTNCIEHVLCESNPIQSP